jgi:formylglycine-generating enzyme required for sulfatase activity
MTGNVHELMEDAFHANYEGAPADGSCSEGAAVGAGPLEGLGPEYLAIGPLPRAVAASS